MSLDVLYPPLRGSRFRSSHDWRTTSQNHLSRSTAKSSKPRKHCRMLCNHPCPVTSIFCGTHDTRYRQVQYTSRPLLFSKATRRHDKTHWLLITLAHWLRATIQNHATQMLSHCLVRITSPTLPRKPALNKSLTWMHLRWYLTSPTQ